MRRAVILLLWVVVSVYQGCNAAIYYVSASAGSAGTGTLSNPWNSIQTAHDNMLPGDTVYVMGGTYTNYAFDYSFVAIYTSGTPGNYITYSAYPGTRPKIVSPCYNGFGLYGASYIVITGFELAGNAGGINGAGQPDGNGIASQENSHHVNITNNVIYSFGGGGIGIVHSDYLNITGNTVYNCSRLSGYQTSGISCWQNFNFDNSQGKYRNIIKNNFVYNNNNTVAPGAGQKVTDGNCIIFDDSRNTQAGSTQGVYTGYTLMENNLCFGNGGRGLHVFSSDNVDVFNNVAYMNNQNPQLSQEGELTAFYASNVRFFNNIVYTHASGTANNVYSSTNITYNNNLYFNAHTISILDPSDISGVDPQFVSPSLNAQTTNFHIKPSSPAIGKGRDTGLRGDVDRDGNARPTGSRWDIGAYQENPTTSSTIATTSATTAATTTTSTKATTSSTSTKSTTASTSTKPTTSSTSTKAPTSSTTTATTTTKATTSPTSTSSTTTKATTSSTTTKATTSSTSTKATTSPTSTSSTTTKATTSSTSTPSTTTSSTSTKATTSPTSTSSTSTKATTSSTSTKTTTSSTTTKATTSSTSTTGSSTTGSPPAGPVQSPAVAGINVTIYGDSVVPPFYDYSWNSGNFNPATATYKHSGTYSYSFKPTNYQGAYFHSENFIDTTKHQGVEFYIFFTPTTNQNIQFKLVNQSGANNVYSWGPTNAVSLYLSGAITTNTWMRGYVPLGIFPPGLYDGFEFVDVSGTSTSALLYLDDVKLIAIPTLDVYTDSVLAPFLDWSWNGGNDNPSATAYVHSGTHSFSFTPTNYQGAYWHASSFVINSLQHAGIEFWVYVLSNTNQNLIFHMKQWGDGSTDPIIYPANPISVYTGGHIIPGVWTRGYIPLSLFPFGSFDGFSFQADGATSSGLFYFDDIKVITRPRTVVFSEGFASPFQDWSWNAGVDALATTPVHSGSYSLSWNPTGYQGVYFHAPSPIIDTRLQRGLEMWVYVQSNTNQQVFLSLKQNYNGDPRINPVNVFSYYTGGSIPAATWTKAFVPFSLFPPGLYDGFQIQDGSGSTTSGLMYLDDISILL